MGFFIYLFVEAIMFIVLFVTYMTYTPLATHPAPEDVFEVKTVVLASIFLLSSSATLFYSERHMKGSQDKKLKIGLGVTLVLSFLFLAVEINEFLGYVQAGYTTSTNVFFGAFYVLVGLHAFHVAFGAGWMITLFIHRAIRLPKEVWNGKFKIFSYYWHFVDLVWVFILILVYIPYL